MADKTSIEWTDATWNVINGCSVLSPGCTNCYAMKQAHRVECRRGLTQKTKGGMVWTGETRFNDKVLRDPLKWKRPRKIFVCAHGDMFHESVPDEWIDRVFAVMALCPKHTFQVLTKRADRMREYLTGPHVFRIVDRIAELGVLKTWDYARALARIQSIQPLPNVWLGVSVEDRTRMLQRAEDLRQTPAAVRWWSAEPLLGDLGQIPMHLMPHWIVAGGESGPRARPMHPQWVRSIREQCAMFDVPFLFKQWGEWEPRDEWGFDVGHRAIMPDGSGGSDDGSVVMARIGKKRAGRLLDGVQHDEYPS